MSLQDELILPSLLEKDKLNTEIHHLPLSADSIPCMFLSPAVYALSTSTYRK